MLHFLQFGYITVPMVTTLTNYKHLFMRISGYQCIRIKLVLNGVKGLGISFCAKFPSQVLRVRWPVSLQGLCINTPIFIEPTNLGF